MKKKLLLLCTIGMMAASLTSCAALDGVKDVLKNSPLGGVLGGILGEEESTATEDSISDSVSDSDDSSSTTHVHSAEHIAAEAATCESVGNIEYWYCSECDGVWTDEALTEAIEMEATVVEKSAHEYTYVCDAHCKNCGELTNEAATHNVIHVDALEAACHYDGNVEYWYCSDCGTAWTDADRTQVTNLKNVVIPATGSDLLVHMDAVAAGCHYNGNIEHWICYECEQVWQDEALTQLTNVKNVVLPATGGDVTHVEAVEATCTTMGNIEYWYCENCMQVWQDENLTQLTNMMNVKLGYGEHEYFYPCDVQCMVCYEETNPDATHTLVHVDAVEATCTATGNVEYWYCSDCGAAWLDEAQTMVTNRMSVKTFKDHEGYEADYKCDECSAVVAPAADSTLTFAQASALGVAGASEVYTTNKYYLTGRITSVYNTTYGNMYIADEAGNEFCVYGTYSADGTTRYDALEYKPVKGDLVTVYGVIGNYNGGAQMKNGWMTEVVKHADEGCTWIDATCLAAKHCQYCGATEGGLADHTYVEGVCSVCKKEEDSTPLANATLSFPADKSNRTVYTDEQQVWEANGIKLTNNKNTSTNNVGDYANPARFYANSEIIIEGAGMTKIEFTCGSSSYATTLQKSITDENATVTVNGSIVTVVFTTAVEQFTIAKLTGQVRMNSITVNPA